MAIGKTDDKTKGRSLAYSHDCPRALSSCNVIVVDVPTRIPGVSCFRHKGPFFGSLGAPSQSAVGPQCLGVEGLGTGLSRFTDLGFNFGGLF